MQAKTFCESSAFTGSAVSYLGYIWRLFMIKTKLLSLYNHYILMNTHLIIYFIRALSTTMVEMFCDGKHFHGQIISGTKCDRDKLICLQQEVNRAYKRDPTGSQKVKKEGQSRGSSLPPSSKGVPPPPSPSP